MTNIQEIVEELQELNLTNHNQKLFNFLIKTDEEREDFLMNYWQGVDKQFFAIVNYRKFKLIENNMTLKEFIDTYNKDRKVALEKLFQYPVGYTTLELLDEKLNKGKFTIEELYNKRQNKPEKLLLNYLL